jgi:hypothetical protein
MGNCKFAKTESSISSSLSVLAPSQVSSWIRGICSRLAMPIANNASKRALRSSGDNAMACNKNQKKGQCDLDLIIHHKHACCCAM